MQTAYFDCFNGAAGDMILAALIDAGLSVDELRESLATLPVTGYKIHARKIDKQNFAATQFDVQLNDDRTQSHRNLQDITRIIQGGALTQTVQRRALAVFHRLAAAEAQAHGSNLDQVHFHEVGAVDAIVDIVGACWALERLRIDRVVCSPIPVGSGTVTCAHGVLPVPAPATALLLRGVPLAATDEIGELTTPTGAAILTEIASAFGPLPAITIERIGVGAGQREGKNRPNVLRVILGHSTPGRHLEPITVLEACIDDATPEVLGYTMERLLNAGALDAYCVPIHMKKARPGMLLTVLATAEQVTQLESIVFRETTTFGIRHSDILRSVLPRRIENVPTRFGDIGVKIGTIDDQPVSVAAEYEDCRAAADRHGVPLREVMTEAVEAWKRKQNAAG